MKHLVITAFAAALIAAPAAFAQDSMGHHDSMDHKDNMGHSDTMAHHDTGHHETMSGPMMSGPMHHGDQAMQHHSWRHGDRLPKAYWHASQVDWNRHHLRRPPHGYHWVQVDGDYVLVALATGVILETALAH